MITDFLLDHKWLMPALLTILVIAGPVIGAWLTARPRVAALLFAVSLLPIVALTLVPVDRELFERCAVQWSLPTPGRVESFANMVLFVPPVLLAGVMTKRPLASLAAGSVGSAGVEALQAAVAAIGRSCDSTDWLANTLGALVGAALASITLVVAHRRRLRRESPPTSPANKAGAAHHR